jgi:hypothetical protein
MKYDTIELEAVMVDSPGYSASGVDYGLKINSFLLRRRVASNAEYEIRIGTPSPLACEVCEELISF